MKCKDQMQKIERMQKKASEVSDFMKCFGSPHRLMILCHLAQGPKNVSELMELTGIPQTSMSQHLNKLKSEGLIDYERDHRLLIYSITNPDVMKIMDAIYDIYCKEFLDCPNEK